MRQQVSDVEQNFFASGNVEFFVKVVGFGFRLADKLIPDSKRNDGYSGGGGIVKTNQVTFGAFGNGNDVVCSFVHEPENELEIPVDDFHRQKFGIYQMGQIVNGDQHFPAIEQGHVAVRHVQNIGLLLAEGAVRELYLFFITVNAADKGNLGGNVVFVSFQIFRVAKGDFVAHILEPVLDAGANTGSVDHACVDGDLGSLGAVRFILADGEILRKKAKKEM